MWIALLILAAALLAYIFRPFAVYKRKVLAEYKRWRGRPLLPVDDDLLATLRSIKAQGLSPREARFVLCTYLDHGSMEAMKHVSALLSGETYKAPERTQADTSHPQVPLATGDSPPPVPSTQSGIPSDVGSFAKSLYADFEREVYFNTGSFRAMEPHVAKPPTLELEIACLLFFAYDLAVCKGPEVDVRRRMRDHLLAALDKSRFPLEQVAIRLSQFDRLTTKASDPKGSYLPLGMAFSENTGNGGYVLVVTWGIFTFKAIHTEACSKVTGFLASPERHANV
jgi:hypothetical protein